MKKFFGVLAAAIIATALSTQARAEGFDASELQLNTVILAQTRAGLNWHVGDKASYEISAMGGFLKGTSDNEVTQDTGTSFWMVQMLKIMGQEQKVETLLNKSTGQIEKLIVNGKEEAIPKSDIEVLEMKEAKVTVPAGSFDCIYVKIKNKEDNKESEAWINPKVVPMSGLLKMSGQSQMGPVSQEATSFSFANH